MPTEQEFRAAQLEAMLSTAFESAEGMEEDGPLPDDVKARISAISGLKPEDLEDEDEEEEEEEEEDEEEEEAEEEDTPPPASFSSPVFGA